MIIGIIGTRRRDSLQDFKIVENAFLKVYKPGDTICSGLCSKGGDRFAVILVQKYKVEPLWFPANWKLGRHAGFLRNTNIAKSSDILIACVSEDRTGGTEDTIKKFINFGKKDKLILV